MIWLLQGDFERGWPEYEWRWNTAEQPPLHFEQPQWMGEPLDGKTILLHAEQGFGDTIQFVRYATFIKNLGATVILECPKPLIPLLASCRAVDRVVEQGELRESYDFHAPLLSLPTVFKTSLTTIPATVPYLFADPRLVDRWREALAGIRGFRIGINWRGRPGRGAYRRRDIPLELFASLAALPGVQLISLQREGDVDLASFANRASIVAPGSDIDTANGAFMDTAAIMKNLDLVITSDTSIPHLAGALGVPVWLALPFVPDWRWLLNRSDSPWYPTMRIFRQRSATDWLDVFKQIKECIGEGMKTPPH